MSRFYGSTEVVDEDHTPIAEVENFEREWTICKCCGDPMQKGGMHFSCCSALCFRDAYC